MSKIIDLYHAGLWNFLSFRRPTAEMSSGWGMRCFMSFEDGLWALCALLDLRPGSLVLLPEFYCMDVVAALQAHGFRTAFYPMTRDLDVEHESFVHELERHNPDVVIIFHPLGLSCGPVVDRSWRRLLSEEAVVIEDCAHLLLNPADLASPVDQREFVIDSLRKVCPLQAARVFGSADQVLQLMAGERSLAGAFTTALYSLWRLCLFFARISGSRVVWSLSERAFLKHNDRIGTARVPQRAPLTVHWCLRSLNYTVGFEHKRRLAGIYHEGLSKTESLSPSACVLRIREDQVPLLKFYPLAVKSAHGEEIVSLLDRRRVHVDLLFPDSPHCKEWSYLALPLGVNITPADAKRVVLEIHRVFREELRT